MKRTELIRKLEEAGCKFIRHGDSNPKTGISQPIPRHREINEFLARHILKKLTD